MRIEYDRAADAAYIYLVETIAPGGVKATHECDLSDITANYGLPPVQAMVNLDFDDQGHLLGIEIVGAHTALPAALLKKSR